MSLLTMGGEGDLLDNCGWSQIVAFSGLGGCNQSLNLSAHMGELLVDLDKNFVNGVSTKSNSAATSTGVGLSPGGSVGSSFNGTNGT